MYDMKNWISMIIVFAMWGTFQMATAQEGEKKEESKYGWQESVVGNLGFTQNAFDNWSKGGENSWSWQLDVLAKFTRKEQNYEWANSCNFSYGQAKVGKQDSRKAADEIKLESVYSYVLNWPVNPYVSLLAQTQFTNGYDYTTTPKIEISNFMDPGYFTEGIGFKYAPSDIIQTRLGAAAKQTITDKYADRYAKGEKLRKEYGAESVTDLDVKLGQNLLYNSKLELFSKLNRFNEVDVNWDNLFTVKATQYINVTWNVRLFYDRDISFKRQLKETLAVGITYTLL
jgi:hypothetical protein